MKLNRTTGVTMLELLVVVLIISVLSSIAVTVYTGQVERARYAAAKATISQLETACRSYEIDVGQFPHSASGNATVPSGPGGPINWGCGNLVLVLLHSINGSATNPADDRWQGPYLEFNADQLGDINGVLLLDQTSSIGQDEINLLDPWGFPYQYVRFDEYSRFGATQLGSLDPFRSSETHYNVSTFQIISFGLNGKTLDSPDAGLEDDDVSNFITK